MATIEKLQSTYHLLLHPTPMVPVVAAAAVAVAFVVVGVAAAAVSGIWVVHPGHSIRQMTAVLLGGSFAWAEHL